jgi:CMP-N,N'-diacetyllegionaminic acid synthase
MHAGQSVVALIPARGGSKSVKLKNLHELGGKPLIQWSIEVARSTPAIDRVIVSTDHPQIAEAARAMGAEVAMRPDELASDTALAIDVLRHHIRKLRAEGESAKWMTLLEPTAPFRLPRDILACLDQLATRDLESVATFMSAHLNPHRAWTIEDGRPRPFIAGAVPWLPRQKLPVAHQLNGAVYAFEMDRLPSDGVTVLFGRSGAVLMEDERSFDIDTLKDFAVANALLANGYIPLS